MTLCLLALLQAASTPPDIAFHATIQARSLTIEKQGEARLTFTADGKNVIDVQAPKANGRKTIPSPKVTVNVEARIADPLSTQPPPSDPRQ